MPVNLTSPIRKSMSCFSFNLILITLNAIYFKRMKNQSSQIHPHETVDLSIDENLYFSQSLK